MKRSLKSVLYGTVGLLALQLAVQPIVSYAETGDISRPGMEISATYVKDGVSATYSSNLSSTAAGYLMHLTNADISMTRVDSSQQLFYNVPRTEVKDGSYIDLDISYSELVRPETSTVTVSIDGRPVRSIPLTKDTSAGLITRIGLSGEDVTPGYHSVTVEKHSVISDDLCDDEENPANWLKINRSSVVFVNTTTSFTTSDALRNYPYPYVEPGIVNEMYGAVMVPDHPSADVIASAMRLAAYLSSKTSTKTATPIVTESEWLRKDNLLPVVALGSVGSWNGPVKQMMEEHPIQVKGKQLSLDTFAVQSLKTNESRQVLLVSAAEDRVIRDQMHVLTEKQYVDQLAGNHLLLEDQPAAQPVSNSAKPITLEDLGASNLKLSNISPKSGNLLYTIPSYWSLTGESELLLKVRVSSLLKNEAAEWTSDKKNTASSEQSGLTVTINGIPRTFSYTDIVSSKKENDSYLLSIPLESYLKASQTETNTITMEFSAHMNKPRNACGPRSENGKWIFIDSSSSLRLPHEINKEKSFKNWPSPFVGDQGFDQTVFLLPKEVDGALLSQLSALIQEMAGGLTASPAIDIVLDGQPDLEQRLKGRNVIVTGNPNSFAALSGYAEKLLMNPGNSEYPAINSNIINETTDYAAWIQTSVWDANRVMAVFQAGESRQQAQSAFTNVSLLKFLNNEQKKSQIAVMSRSGDVLSFAVGRDPELRSAATAESDKGGRQSLIWMAAAVCVVFMIGLVFFIRMLRRRK